MKKLTDAINKAKEQLGEKVDKVKLLQERLTKKVGKRKGKRVVFWKTDRKGYKVVKVKGRPKEVRLTPAELMKRRKRR